jgi:hypothetical protein
VIKGKTLRHTLDKFLKNSEVAKEARVQVCLPNGEFYDITGMQLMENKLLGNRESHRLIIVSSDSYRDEKLYEGSRCLELAACGLRLEACCLGLESIYDKFKRL